MKDNHRVRVVYACAGGHKHELCMHIQREVPKELRCEVGQAAGYGPGGGGCTIPLNLDDRVMRSLRDDLQEARRRGHVLIVA